MKKRISRRQLIKSIPNVTLGVGLLTLLPGKKSSKSTSRFSGNQINIKVLPPGPKLLALLEDVRNYISTGGCSLLYGVGFKGGSHEIVVKYNIMGD